MRTLDELKKAIFLDDSGVYFLTNECYEVDLGYELQSTMNAKYPKSYLYCFSENAENYSLPENFKGKIQQLVIGNSVFDEKEADLIWNELVNIIKNDPELVVYFQLETLEENE